MLKAMSLQLASCCNMAWKWGGILYNMHSVHGMPRWHPCHQLSVAVPYSMSIVYSCATVCTFECCCCLCYSHIFGGWQHYR